MSDNVSILNSQNENHVINVETIDNEKITNSSEFSVELDKNIEMDKQQVFDRFLTYRRRMARLTAVQVLYMYDIRKKINDITQKTGLFNQNKDDLLILDISAICQDVLSYYKEIVFTPQDYGWTKKNKKIDESFMQELVFTTIHNINGIDELISQKLNANWTVDKLDITLKSIIRCAIAEIICGTDIEKPVLSSEYTNVASQFFSNKEIGFINGITDKLYDLAVNFKKQNNL